MSVAQFHSPTKAPMHTVSEGATNAGHRTCTSTHAHPQRTCNHGCRRVFPASVSDTTDMCTSPHDKDMDGSYGTSADRRELSEHLANSAQSESRWTVTQRISMHAIAQPHCLGDARLFPKARRQQELRKNRSYD
mmetsp:Transcript_1362/g.3245  ORF Transcript_1362/g.3245 Transcript_1362/m.3245 type:complete len:134 (-) Transcript_1362:170-571(-)